MGTLTSGKYMFPVTNLVSEKKMLFNIDVYLMLLSEKNLAV